MTDVFTGYTQAQYELSRCAKSVSIVIDRGRWLLAEMADDAEANKVEKWAEIIGAACRRSPKTVYEWRQAYSFRKSRNPESRLDISFWITAAHEYDPEQPELVTDWLAVCEGDETITVESARANLPRKKKEPEPPTFRDSLLVVAEAVTELAAHRDVPKMVQPFLEKLVMICNDLMSAFDNAKR